MRDKLGDGDMSLKKNRRPPESLSPNKVGGSQIQLSIEQSRLI